MQTGRNFLRLGFLFIPGSRVEALMSSAHLAHICDAPSVRLINSGSALVLLLNNPGTRCIHTPSWTKSRAVIPTFGIREKGCAKLASGSSITPTSPPYPTPSPRRRCKRGERADV
ncbi:hypothetical protein FA10DRAFT_188903 [Acaromyces ingoldii]|uniref:Uncharacterized protein n=1 Tax=Acaromyces ingoldii TaxID=215250 RepID=A0A316YHI2_9BASI|nr:hypothetical protein FA10DRAFT_188903 [Acaromyces ingoldii]PWN87563.1 hypothetical protein FA10DRAFT_188903 [Acaromyces ingoldii]